MRRARLITSLVCVVSLFGCAMQSASENAKPRIVSVTEWGGTPPVTTGVNHSINKLTVHHQGVFWKPDGDVIAYLRRLQGWSRVDKQWVDIPYHFIVAFDGTVYEGRPWNLAGDTNTAYDPRGHLLVMLMGNFEEQSPTDAQWSHSVELVAALMRKHRLGIEALATHRDYATGTQCPGENFYRRMDEFRDAVAHRLK